MMVKLLISFFFLIAIAAPQLSPAQKYYGIDYSQDPLYYIGFYGGYNSNNHVAQFDTLDGVTECCPFFDIGTGSGLYAGGLFEYIFSDKLKMQIRCGFSMLNGTLSKDKPVLGRLVKEKAEPNNLVIRDLEVNQTLTTTIFSAGLEPMIGFNIFSGINLFAGMRLGYIVVGKFDNVQKILTPLDVTYQNGNTEDVDEGVSIPNTNNLQLHAVAGFEFDIPLGKHTFITPEIKYQLPFTNLSNAKWNVTSLQFGAALKLPIYPSKPLKPVVDDTLFKRDTSVIAVFGLENEKITLVNRTEKNAAEEKADRKIIWTIINESYKKEIPKRIKLQTSVKAIGIGHDGKRQDNPTIVLQIWEIEQGTVPLLPYIFFKEGDADINKTAMSLLSAEKVRTFTEESLELNVLDIYSELLNLVGSRMIKYTEANLTVVGCNNNLGPEEDNIALSSNRAEILKDYLVKNWGIESYRIHLKSQGLPDKPANNKHMDGQKENQRAELKTDTYEILAPAFLKKHKLETNYPFVEIKPEIIAEGGIRSWNIEVTQGGNLLRKYAGTGKPDMMKWKIIEDPIPELEVPVEIELTVEDRYGQKSVSTTSCKVIHETRQASADQAKGIKLTEKYFLVAHYDESDILANQMEFIKYIKSRIRPHSYVNISGHADRTGSKGYNKRLAKQRVNSIDEIFAVDKSKKTLNAVGSDKLLYDNDLPQGRCYNRCVIITIETTNEE